MGSRTILRTITYRKTHTVLQYVFDVDGQTMNWIKDFPEMSIQDIFNTSNCNFPYWQYNSAKLRSGYYILLVELIPQTSDEWIHYFEEITELNFDNSDGIITRNKYSDLDKLHTNWIKELPYVIIKHYDCFIIIKQSSFQEPSMTLQVAKKEYLPFSKIIGGGGKNLIELSERLLELGKECITRFKIVEV
jgi:hypothetical protein